MRENIKPTKTKIRGTAWVGLWNNGEPGWLAPRFVSDGHPESLNDDQLKALGILSNNEVCPGDMYRAEITIKLKKTKRGRFIVRRAK